MLQFREEFICTFSLTALHIDAEVVRWVYTVGSERPSASSTLQGTPMPASVVSEESINLLEVMSSNIVLTIFAANVDVRLDKKMTEELLRATKKNPPSRLRYELVYVSFIVLKGILKMSFFFSDGERR